MLMFLVGAYMIGTSIYNIMVMKNQTTLVTNALVAAVGGGFVFYAFTKLNPKKK